MLDRNNLIYTVDVQREIDVWKKKNPGENAIICIDFLTLDQMVKVQAEWVCGGRHQQFLNVFEQFFKRMDELGVKLVFFSDCNPQYSQLDKWVKRRNESFLGYKRVYDYIESGDTLKNIVKSMVGIFGDNQKTLSSSHYGLAKLAEKYGEFHYSVNVENDLALAQYATENNALAILTNDTDFLIFDGPWKLWSAYDFNISTMKTHEYDRKGFLRLSSLTYKQLPLFATLTGNDVMSKFYDKELANFHRYGLKGRGDKMLKIASYVRSITNDHLSDSTLKQVASDVFHDSSYEKCQIICDSIQSYDLKLPQPDIDDTIAKRLMEINPNVCTVYTTHAAPANGITLCFYDMRDCKNDDKSLPSLFVDWMKRRIGIVRQHTNDRDFTFTLLAKQNYNQIYTISKENPIYPDISVPPLDQLMVNDVENEENQEVDEEMINIRWKLLGWILTISNEKIDSIRSLPKDLILICTVLYLLVRNKFLDIQEADGILLSEQEVLTKLRSAADLIAELPLSLIPKYVRAAHMYNITHQHVRTSLAVVGLTHSMATILRFDGVYFQNLMNSFAHGKIDEQHFVDNINEGRIYV